MSLKDLGLPPDASEEDVRQAYKRLAWKTHPDQGGTPGAFQQLQQWRDAAIIEVTTPSNCPECAGSGSKFVGAGFSRIKLPCEKCDGTGKAKRK